MRKLTLFLALCLFCVGRAAADVLPELAGRIVSIGPAVANFETDTWYFLHQSRLASGGAAGTHSTVGQLPATGGYAYDTGVGQRAKKSALDVVASPTSTLNAGQYMVRFLNSSNTSGAYIIQFGTGNYLDGNLNITANRYDAVDLNVYRINGTDGHFGINKWNKANRLDNNGANSTLAWWDSGELTTLNGNNDWAIHEVTYQEVSDHDVAIVEVNATLTQYSAYRTTLVAGTRPGLYEAAAVTAFHNALDAAEVINTPAANDLSAAQIRALGQAIVDTYNACLAARIPYTAPDGYYYIVSAMEWTQTVDGEDTHPTKAIYTDGTNIKWATLEEDNCTFLWRLESRNGSFWLHNIAHDGGINDIVNSTAATMAAAPTAVRFEPLGILDGDVVKVGITGASQTGAYQYVHCGGHNGGAGTAGNIVGWSIGGIPASEWIMQPVSNADAQAIIEAYAPIKNHDLLVEQYRTMQRDAQAKLAITKTATAVLHEDQPLVTDASQFSSEYTTTDAQTVNGTAATAADVYGFLIDGNASTYWHSRWEGGNVAGGTHYLQVQMPDTEVAYAAFRFTRRAVANDHVTVWGVYGSNDATLAKADWTELTTIETPLGSNTETLTSYAFPTNGYRYLRFYLNATTTGRGYGHVSEFQLYPADAPANLQYTKLGTVASNLANVLTAQQGLSDAELTIDHYNALKPVYDAFIAKYVDPRPLRNKIAEVAGLAALVRVGNNPGEWRDASAATTITNTVTRARQYDESGAYTAATTENWLFTLGQLNATMMDGANQVQTTKWYNIRFGTEAEYDNYGWGKDNATGTSNATTGRVTPALFGKYLAVAQRVVTDTENDVYTIEPIQNKDVAIGQNLHFVQKDAVDADMAKFRFIAVGDTAYVIQNKGTGLFLKAAGTSGQVRLDILPSLFTLPRPIGYGQTVVAARTMETGASCNYLHAQRDNNVLVTWNASNIGSNSGLFIEEAENVASYTAPACQMDVLPSKLNTCCFPVSVEALSDSVTFYLPTLKGAEVKLHPVPGNRVAAGQPFVLVYGSLDSYDPQATATKRIRLSHGTGVVHDPAAVSGILEGTFAAKNLSSGVIVEDGNKFVVAKRSSNAVSANTAYIVPETPIALETVLTQRIDIDLNEDGAITVGDLARVVRDAGHSTYLPTYTADEVLASGDGQASGYRFVDLGLPSGTQWATCNVGATAPQQKGATFTWSGTTPNNSNCPANNVTIANLRDSFHALDAYNNLNAGYDAASANMGSDWRMPTSAEATELVNHCTWEATTLEGQAGWLVTGANGRHIFIPGATDWYWTSTVSVLDNKANGWKPAQSSASGLVRTEQHLVRGVKK